MATIVEQAPPRKRFLRSILSTSIQLVFYLFSKLDRIVNLPMESDFDTQDPYPFFASLQLKSPILRSFMYSGWAITGHEEITHLIRRSEISTDLRGSKFFSRVLKIAAGDASVPMLDNPNMLNLDAPDHTRLRKLMASRFTLKFVQALEPQIASQCRSLINEIELVDGQFDLLDAIAKPLPALVIADMLGVPESMYEQFQEWSEALLGTAIIGQPDMIRKAGIANDALHAYFESLTEEKRKNPGQDLISQLIEAEETGDRLTLKELHTNCILLLIAGHETTTRLIGNGMWLLLKHPEQMALLQENRELIPNAIEEMLRYEPPVQAFSRIVKEDFEYKGYNFKKNQVALLFYAAANRDPRFIENPQTFDIRRKDPKHISFGHGVHLCLGMSLARLEAKIVFNQILDNFPVVSLVDAEPDWGINPFFRGLDSLRVNVD